jgi:hypothetical protein
MAGRHHPHLTGAATRQGDSVMPTAEAHIPTRRASRYLVQLCRHLDQLKRLPHPASDPAPAGGSMPQVDDVHWSDTHGTVAVGQGTWVLDATPDALTVRVEAADQQSLRQVQAMLTNRIEQIGRRDRLAVTWRDPHTTGAEPDPAPTTAEHATAARRRTVLVVALAVLAVGAHIAVATTALAGVRWTSWAADAIVVIVAVKMATLALAGRRLRHRTHRPHRIPHHSRRP